MNWDERNQVSYFLPAPVKQHPHSNDAGQKNNCSDLLVVKCTYIPAKPNKKPKKGLGSGKYSRPIQHLRRSLNK